jgi:hypothetical protein
MPDPIPTELAPLLDVVQAGNLSVILAFRDELQAGIRYRVLRADVDESFRRAAVTTVTSGIRALRGYDVVAYDSSRLSATKEMSKRTLAQAGLEELANTLRQPAVLNPAGFRDFDDGLAFYAFVFIEHGKSWVAFIRQAYQVQVSSIHKLVAVFRQQRLTKPSDDQRVLRFDEHFDFILDQASVYVLRDAAFDNLFVDRVELQARVPGQVDLLIEHGLPINNASEFVAACQTNLNMMRKLQRIADSGYLDQITPERIGRLVSEYKLSPAVISGGKLNFDPKDRWLILKMLDDDYLSSGLTDRRYEVNSKVTITR